MSYVQPTQQTQQTQNYSPVNVPASFVGQGKDTTSNLPPPTTFRTSFEKTTSDDIVKQYKGKILYTKEGDEVLVQGFVRRDPKHRILVYSTSQRRDYAVTPRQLSTSPVVAVTSSTTGLTPEQYKAEEQRVLSEGGGFSPVGGGIGQAKYTVQKRTEYFGGSSPTMMTSQPYKLIPERETKEYKQAQTTYARIQSGKGFDSVYGRVFMKSYVTSPEKLGIYAQEITGFVSPQKAQQLYKQENIKQIQRMQTQGAFPEFVRSPAFQVPASTLVGAVTGGGSAFVLSKFGGTASRLIGAGLIAGGVGATGLGVLEMEENIKSLPEYSKTGSRLTFAGSVVGGIAGGVTGFRDVAQLRQPKPDVVFSKGKSDVLVIKKPGEEKYTLLNKYVGKFFVADTKKSVSYPYDVYFKGGYEITPTQGGKSQVAGITASKVTPITAKKPTTAITGELVAGEGMSYYNPSSPAKIIQRFTGQRQDIQSLKLSDTKTASKLIIPLKKTEEYPYGTVTTSQGVLLSGTKTSKLLDVINKDIVRIEEYNLKNLPSLKSSEKASSLSVGSKKGLVSEKPSVIDSDTVSLKLLSTERPVSKPKTSSVPKSEIKGVLETAKQDLYQQTTKQFAKQTQLSKYQQGLGIVSGALSQKTKLNQLQQPDKYKTQPIELQLPKIRQEQRYIPAQKITTDVIQSQQQRTMLIQDLMTKTPTTPTLTPRTPPIPTMTGIPPLFPKKSLNMLNWGGGTSTKPKFMLKKPKTKGLKYYLEPDILAKSKSLKMYGKATPIPKKYESRLKQLGYNLGVRVPTLEQVKKFL